MAESKYKPLSFSTTMRNPNRIAKFLECLLPFENMILTNEVIMKIIIKVVSIKIYAPNFGKAHYGSYYADDDTIIPEEISKRIVENSPQKHKEAGFDYGWPSRFETIFQLPKEFGFVYYAMNEPIIITQLGHMIIDALNENPVNSQKIESVFLNSLLKYPTDNPYRKVKNNNIPLMLLLKVIDLLKHDPEENGAGVHRKELALFICWPNDDYMALYNHIKRIRSAHRSFDYSDEYIYDMCLELLQTDNTTYIKMDRIFGDATDEYIRKMRITGIFSLRGNGRFLDINELKKEKIDYILNHYSASYEQLDEKEYTDYIGNIDSNILSIEESITVDTSEIKQQAIQKYANEKTKEYIDTELKLLCIGRPSHDDVFRFIPEPARFEFLTSIALKQRFHDTLDIKPNYTVDDEGLPTSTAGGNIGDIICYDSEYTSDVEVSLMCGRSDQVNNEIVPIRRHLLEIKNETEKAFAVFVAPRIHVDTIEVAKLYKIREQLDILTFNINDFLEKIDEVGRFQELVLAIE